MEMLISFSSTCLQCQSTQNCFANHAITLVEGPTNSPDLRIDKRKMRKKDVIFSEVIGTKFPPYPHRCWLLSFALITSQMALFLCTRFHLPILTSERFFIRSHVTNLFPVKPFNWEKFHQLFLFSILSFVATVATFLKLVAGTKLYKHFPHFQHTFHAFNGIIVDCLLDIHVRGTY